MPAPLHRGENGDTPAGEIHSLNSIILPGSNTTPTKVFEQPIHALEETVKHSSESPATSLATGSEMPLSWTKHRLVEKITSEAVRLES